MRAARFAVLLVLTALATSAFALAATPARADLVPPSIDPVSEVTYDSVRVSGTVSQAGGAAFTVASFEVSTDNLNWNSVTTSEVFGPDLPVSATINSLRGGTHYYVRLRAFEPFSTGEAISPGPNPEFTTFPVDPPTVLTVDNATDVSFVSARVEGKVERPANPPSPPFDPNSAFNTNCNFEYVIDAKFNETGFQGAAKAGCEPENPIKMPGPTEVSANLSGLAAGATYHLRLSAENAGGVDTLEAPSTFTMQAATPPSLALDPPIEVSYVRAHISGTINPEGGNVDFSAGPLPILWQLQTNREGEGWELKEAGTIEGEAAKSTDPITVPADLTNLQPNSEYKFRLIASYANLEVVSVEGSFETEAVSPPVVSINPITIFTGTSASLSGKVDPSGSDPAFDSSWRFECTPACPVPLEGQVSAADGEQVVGANPTDLEPNTSYQVELIASNQGGQDLAGPVSFKTSNLPPLVQTLGAGALQSSSAQLAAQINPQNSSVTYLFEWGKTLAYGGKSPAILEPLADVDNVFHLVTTALAGLDTGTTYHYRVVARNTETGIVTLGEDRAFSTRSTVEPITCPNESSRVGPSSELPDCRAYELASPGLNGSAISTTIPTKTSVAGKAIGDGSTIWFQTEDAPDDAQGSFAFGRNIARRGLAGWATKSLVPPTPEQSVPYITVGTVKAISSDFSQAVVLSEQPLAGPASPEGTNLYLRNADATFVPLSLSGPPAMPEMTVTGTSRDFTHIFFNPRTKQFDEDPTEGGNTYEWIDGDLRLVGVLPGGVPAPGGGAIPLTGVQGASSVSEDGEFVLFIEGTADGGGTPIPTGGPLYLRKHGNQTLDVSAPERSSPDLSPPALPEAVGVSADGSEVLFTSRAELTDGANTGETEGIPNGQGKDIYAFNVETGELADLTIDNNSADAATGANVEEVVGLSRDASYIYFIATGNLAPGAVSGEKNLYVEHGGVIKFIAPADGMYFVTEGLGGPFVYVTPDGHHLAFSSADNLTGYDTGGFGSLFKYTYGAGIECASCRPSGELPTAAISLLRGRTLSDDGTRVFFQSPDAVLPRASNGLTNVYEYQAGQVSLLSPGDDESSATLLDASASGNDVFIVSYAELAHGDQGTAAAIYDARVNAQVPPPGEPEPCSDAGCRESPTVPDEAVSPGTAQFRAAGQVIGPRSQAVAGSKGRLRLTLPEAGRVSIAGNGLKPVGKNVFGPRTLGLGIALKVAANKARLRFGVFKTKAQIVFRSNADNISRLTVSLKFEADTKKGGQ